MAKEKRKAASEAEAALGVLEQAETAVKQNNPPAISIAFTGEELKILSQLVYLGNFVINGYRKPRECCEKYAELADKIYVRFYADLYRIADVEDVEANEAADVRDRMCDETDSFVYDFCEENFFEKLAETLAKKYYFPSGEKGGCLIDSVNAEIEYFRLLKEKGLSFVTIEAPRIDEAVNSRRGNLKE